MTMTHYPDGEPCLMMRPHPIYNNGSGKVSTTTKWRHRIRDYFWSASMRDVWLLRGQVSRLEDRCACLEAAIKELNPGWAGTN